MADTIEFEAETEELAVQRASEALGVDGDALDYTVVDEGSEGVFGLGSRPVKIRVRPVEGAADSSPASEDDDSEAHVPARRGPAPEKAAQAEEVMKTILGHMAVAAQVEVRDEDENIVIVVQEVEGSTQVAEVLGGARPPVIPALQFLLNKIVNRFPEDRKHVTVEVPAVPKRERRSKERSPNAEKTTKVAPDAPMPTLEELRGAVDEELDASLIEVALELAERSRKLGKTLSIHPMLPGDRRAIHQTMMKIPGVHTVSEGEGVYRRMHVVPDALGGPGGGGNRGGKRRRRRRRSPGKGGQDSATT